MTLLQTISLVVHVVAGVVGVIAAYTILIEILRREPQVKKLVTASVFSLVGYLLSWVSGGYYYLTFYGSQVKPLILNGPYPLAHSIFTEAKEHVFIFLPLIAAVTCLLVCANKAKLTQSGALKKSFTWLTVIQVVLGVFVTVAGFIMSGSVRLS